MKPLNWTTKDRSRLLVEWQTKHRLSAKHAKNILICSVGSIYQKRHGAANVTDRDLVLMQRYDQDHPNP